MSGTDGAPPPAFSDSDREWYAALTGEAGGAADSAAAREGRMLRSALEERRGEIDAGEALSDAASERQLKRLLDAAEAEGLFAPAPLDVADRPTSNVVTFPWWRRRRALLALAASVLLGVVLLGPWIGRPDYPEPTQTFGADGIRSTRNAAPKAAAERLGEGLRRAGLRPGLYQRGRTYIVDVTLLPSELTAAGPAFRELGLAPQAGPNRVEIAPR